MIGVLLLIVVLGCCAGDHMEVDDYDGCGAGGSGAGEENQDDGDVNMGASASASAPKAPVEKHDGLQRLEYAEDSLYDPGFLSAPEAVELYKALCEEACVDPDTGAVAEGHVCGCTVPGCMGSHQHD